MASRRTTNGPALSPAEERARQVLVLTMKLLGWKDRTLAEAVGVSRSTIEGKTERRSRIRLGTQDVAYAEAMDVPVELFGMDPFDAASWLFANRSEQVIAAFGWLAGSPNQGTLFQSTAA